MLAHRAGLVILRSLPPRWSGFLVVFMQFDGVFMLIPTDKLALATAAGGLLAAAAMLGFVL